MSDTVEITIPVDAEAAQALKSPARRAAAGRYLSGLLKDGRARIVLEEAFAEAKSEARANGLTEADIDAELEAWCAERKPTLVNGKVTQKRSARLKVSLRPGVPLRTRAEPR